MASLADYGELKIGQALFHSAIPHLKALFAEKHALPQAIIIVGANGSGKSVFCRALAEHVFPSLYGKNVCMVYSTGNHYADSLTGMDKGIIRTEPLTDSEFKEVHENLVFAKKHGSTAKYVLICDDLTERVTPNGRAARFALLARNANAIPIFTFHCITHVPAALLGSVPYRFFLNFGHLAKLADVLRPIAQFPECMRVTKNDFASAVSKALSQDGSILLWTNQGNHRVIIYRRMDGDRRTIGDHIALVADYRRSKK